MEGRLEDEGAGGTGSVHGGIPGTLCSSTSLLLSPQHLCILCPWGEWRDKADLLLMVGLADKAWAQDKLHCGQPPP